MVQTSLQRSRVFSYSSHDTAILAAAACPAMQALALQCKKGRQHTTSCMLPTPPALRLKMPKKFATHAHSIPKISPVSELLIETHPQAPAIHRTKLSPHQTLPLLPTLPGGTCIAHGLPATQRLQQQLCKRFKPQCLLAASVPEVLLHPLHALHSRHLAHHLLPVALAGRELPGRPSSCCCL